MKTITKITAVALFAIAAAGCKQASKYALTDGEWALISWNDDAGEEQVVVTNRPTMKFDSESKVSGNAGCNQFSGRYTVKEEEITIDMGALTRKMCLDMTLEEQMVWSVRCRMSNVSRSMAIS